MVVFRQHDCFNNVEFYKDGASLQFKALVDIAIDEELFTNYGKLIRYFSECWLIIFDPLGAGYFEESNAACLCATCEQCVQLTRRIQFLR